MICNLGCLALLWQWFSIFCAHRTAPPRTNSLGISPSLYQTTCKSIGNNHHRSSLISVLSPNYLFMQCYFQSFRWFRWYASFIRLDHKILLPRDFHFIVEIRCAGVVNRQGGCQVLALEVLECNLLRREFNHNNY